MKPVRCHFCSVALTRYVALKRATCADCDGNPVRACQGCVSVGRKDHTDPRPTPGSTALEAWA